MNLSRYFRFTLIGAIMTVAGTAHAIPAYFPETWTHGNSCTGTGIVPSIYGPYNSSKTTPAAISCPLVSTWSYALAGTPRYITVSYYNRNPNVGAYSCQAYGFDNDGNNVWTGASVIFPAGAPGSTVKHINLGQPRDDSRSFTVSCTLPPNTAGTGNGYSHLVQIGIHVGP